MPKRKNADETDGDVNSGLTDYEKARAKIIQSNLARLQALGIPDTLSQLKEVVQEMIRMKFEDPRWLCRSAKVKKAAKAARTKYSAPSVPSAPLRRSRRRRDEGEQDDGAPEDGIDEHDRELAVFIVDGDCPRCGKVITKGHKAHLASCQGRAKAKEQPGLEGLITVEAKHIKEFDETKLQQLDVGGLIELTPDHASFMVVGSTGRHYKVELSDAKRKCQCVDHRCRKHDCKHIRLMLKTLNIESRPLEWHAAVDAMVMQHAGAAGASKQIEEQPIHTRPRTAALPAPSAGAEMAAKFL